MASKNVIAKGTTYNGVESITLPTSPSGSATFYEISDTTAVASDVASGKYFYDALGVLTQGTASGGGGGLEYETGTWTPSEDIVKGTVSFQKTHTKPPYMIAMSDSTGTNDNAPTYTGYAFMFFDYSSWGGYIESGAATNTRAGYISFARRNTGSSAPSVNYNVFNYGADNLGDSSASYSRYYADESAFYPECNNASVYWRTGRTYKWIAVWAPTT